MLSAGVSSVAGAGLGGLLGQLGDVLSMPRRGAWSMLGLPEQGSDLVGQALGLDPQSALAQALGIGAEVAGDPLMYAGSVLGPLGRMGARGLTGGREAGLMGEGAELMAGAGRRPGPLSVQLGRDFALPEATGQGAAFGTPQYFAEAQKMIEADAAQQALAEQAALGRGAGAAPVQAAGPGIRVTEGQRALEEYKGTLGALHDQSTDLLGKGFATPDEHMVNTQMGGDLLELLGQSAREGYDSGLMGNVRIPTQAATGLGGNPAALGPLGQREAEALLMRKYLANAEGTLPNISNMAQESPLYDMAGKAVDQLEGVGGGPKLDTLLQRGVEQGRLHGATGDNIIEHLLRGNPEAEAALALSQTVADAHLANPAVQQARRLSQAADDLTLSRAAPEQVPALIQELQRFGLPVDPAQVQRDFGTGVISNLNTAARDLNAPRLLPAAEDPGFIEALQARGGNELLRQLGPGRFQRNIPKLDEVLENMRPDAGDYSQEVSSWARRQAPGLNDTLGGEMMLAGLPAGGPAREEALRALLARLLPQVERFGAGSPEWEALSRLLGGDAAVSRAAHQLTGLRQAAPGFNVFALDLDRLHHASGAAGPLIEQLLGTIR